MLTNEMSQPLRTACEAIYSEFKGRWPSDSECARLQCAIDAVLRAERSRTETLRAALEAITEVRDWPSEQGWQMNAIAERALAASVEETP